MGKTRIGTDNLHSLSGQPVAQILVRTADQQGTRELPGDIPKPVEQLIRHIAVKEIMGGKIPRRPITAHSAQATVKDFVGVFCSIGHRRTCATRVEIGQGLMNILRTLEDSEESLGGKECVSTCRSRWEADQ